MTRTARARVLGTTLRRAAAELERNPYLLSGLAGGGWVDDLEEGFGSWLGTEYVLATSSATGALVTALRALGLASGDEVIVPSYCWVGCVGAIQLVGGTPVFVDIREDTFQADPESVLDAIGPRTAAILAPHLCGYPCAIDDLAVIARDRGLALVEDCAQAPGATVAGKAVGHWGDFAVFSFGPGKLIDAGEGGMLVARTAELQARALLVAQHPLRQAMGVRDASLRSQIGGGSTLNFRIHPLAALLANAQLDGIAEWLEIMARAHDRLRDWLVQIEPICPAALPLHHRPNGAMIPLRIDTSAGEPARAELIRRSASEGIEIVEGPIGRPCHLRPGVAARRRISLSATERRCSGEELLARVNPEAFAGIRSTAVATHDRGFDLTSMTRRSQAASSTATTPGTERASSEGWGARSGSAAGGGKAWRS